MTAQLLCFFYIALDTFKEDIRASVHLFRFIFIRVYVVLHKPPITISFAFSIAFISICCIMFIDNSCEVVD